MSLEHFPVPFKRQSSFCKVPALHEASLARPSLSDRIYVKGRERGLAEEMARRRRSVEAHREVGPNDGEPQS